MGLLSRKKRSAAEDVALPLPELDADSAPAPAAEATSSDEDSADAVDLSVVDPGAGGQPAAAAEASPAAAAGEAQAGGADDLDLFRGLSYVSPETELLLSRVKDVSAAELLADLRQVRALLMNPPGAGSPGVPF